MYILLCVGVWCVYVCWGFDCVCVWGESVFVYMCMGWECVCVYVCPCLCVSVCICVFIYSVRIWNYTKSVCRHGIKHFYVI